MINRQQNSRRSGMSTMELALILPFIFALVMGFIELGNMFYSWMTIQKAAQIGARFATTGLGDEEGNRVILIIQETEDWMASLDGNKEIVVRSWPTTSASGAGIEGSAGDPCHLVEVQVIYDYKPFTPLISSVLPTTIKMSGKERKLNEPWKPCG